eukprot:scaffold39115_cov65-Phaeocystis_antarctica.AAC.10
MSAVGSMHANGPSASSAQGWAKNSLALEATTARLMKKLKSSAEADSIRAYWMASFTRCGEARLMLRESTSPECRQPRYDEPLEQRHGVCVGHAPVHEEGDGHDLPW